MNVASHTNRENVQLSVKSAAIVKKRITSRNAADKTKWEIKTNHQDIRVDPSEKATHNVDIFTADNTQSEPLFQEYLINGVPLKFQVDTGAAMSIISKNQWVKLDSPKLASTEMIPTNYDGSRI